MSRVLLYCFLMSLSATTYAQTPLQFDVRAQPLSDALRIVASQTNTNILYDPSLVAGRQVIALKTESTLDEVLVQLLIGSGLKHQYVNEKTVTLVRADPQLIPASSEIKPLGKSATGVVRHISSAAK